MIKEIPESLGSHRRLLFQIRHNWTDLLPEDFSLHKEKRLSVMEGSLSKATTIYFVFDWRKYFTAWLKEGGYRMKEQRKMVSIKVNDEFSAGCLC